MSYRWPDKDPDELLDYTVDWATFLDGDTISNVIWFCLDADSVKTAFDSGDTVNELVNSSVANSTTTATVYLGGGTVNTLYTVVCQIETAAGRIAERSIYIRVRSK